MVKLGADGEVIGAWNVSALIGSPVKAVGIAVGPDGRIWVTDSDGGRLVAITPG
ncbi:MAG: hypothetical protein IPK16_00190 [Anaerolineales bacterium]|nr:hypothetical protein [Anaerolineales bacterium]